MNPINERVKELRLKLKMSQSDFGKAIGLSKSGISNIENGTRAVRENHIKLLCSTFNVSETWLRTGCDLASDVANLESFISFLKSLHYMVNIQQITEDEFEVVLKKNGKETLFTDKEFNQFQDEVLKFVDYHVWQKQQSQDKK
jgi:transcriptional regulator with XRE-family HTH domain